MGPYFIAHAKPEPVMTTRDIVSAAFERLARPGFLPDDRWLMLQDPIARLLSAACLHSRAALLAVTNDDGPMCAQVDRDSYYTLAGWTVIVGDAGGISHDRLCSFGAPDGCHHLILQLNRVRDGAMSELDHLTCETIVPIANWMIAVVCRAKHGPTGGIVPDAWSLIR